MKKQLNLLKALADETRIKILKSLLDGEKSVLGIVSLVGKAQPTISLHLRLLEHLEIIESEKRGKFVFYKIKEEKVKEIFEILEIK